METLANLALIFICTLLIISVISGNGRDSTDPPGEHSGLKLYVDHATGVHYVQGGPFGGITPRLNADGSLYREGRQ